MQRIVRPEPMQRCDDADLTVVSNDRDADALVNNGADRRTEIAILPLGLTPLRLNQFAAVRDAVPDEPVVGFVGTFDPRKGMREFRPWWIE